MTKALTFDSIVVLFKTGMTPLVSEILPTSLREYFTHQVDARVNGAIPFGMHDGTAYTVRIEGSCATLRIKPKKAFTVQEVREFQVAHYLGEDSLGPGMMPDECSDDEVQKQITWNVHELRKPWAYRVNF